MFTIVSGDKSFQPASLYYGENDADRTQAIATRNRILRYAAANSLTVLCAHAPHNGVIF